MKIFAFIGGSSSGTEITVVADYNALPPANTVGGQFYWCSNPVTHTTFFITITDHVNGLYYSNGTTWEFIDTPIQATQTEVDTGTVENKFVSPKTFNDSAQLAAKVPYTGATGDVDLGNNDLNAEGIKVKGTAGNGHISMKHQSSGATASASESVIYADTSGNPKWKNDGNTVQSVMLENSAITGATKTKITYDSKGLVTNGADLTSSDILGFLGWWQYNRITESSAITNTIIETIIENITIPANTYLSGGILRLYNLKIRKVGTVGATTAMKIYIGPNSNNLSGATLIATYSSLAANVVTIEMLRTFTATTTALLGFGSGSSSAVDTGTGATARTSTSVDWTVNQYIIITIQAASLLDSYTMIGASAKNF